MGSADISGRIFVETRHPPPGNIRVDRFRDVLARIMQAEDVNLESLTLVLADHETVRELNRRHLDHDYDTDVLAFDYRDGTNAIDGEIYVDLDMAHERCGEFGVDAEEEAMRYAVHGLLHLIGYSDKTPEKKTEMRTLEDRYLKEAGG